ncbi:phosphoribosyltransferase [Nocardia sp. CDC159]|uniref:Phosphoribosyltransferase n=1 Tax=Nocardia pulmonis TaxID=2951408 RepID=A0A9X2IWS8_9NOCA|nr:MULTISPECIES: phosphoribosyltransferase family protein [Nocardia]MCM6773095.1 phosphoribosyltransferase [Nocardia pulmonis]MCM6785602.1 phosphoribosyltransferase [Nocardia sp. CDC159]
MPFLDRREAGRRLVERLRAFRGPETVVLGLPCGGVPVAYEVATALRAPLDVAVVAELEVPGRPRLVFGAVAEGGVRVVDDEQLVRAFIGPAERARLEREAREAVLRRAARFRSVRERLCLTGRTVVLVDDGVATGATARAACLLARKRGAGRVVFAVPVGSCRPIRALSAHADNVICLETPALFHSIEQWYRTFDPVTEATVGELLERAADQLRTPPTQPIRLGHKPVGRDATLKRVLDN